MALKVRGDRDRSERHKDRGDQREHRSSSHRDRGGSGFAYKKRDPGKVKERANQQGGAFDQMFKQGIPQFSPKPGKDYRIRVMPPTWEGAEDYAYEVWVHYGVGADNQRYICLDKMSGGKEPCPCCEEYERLRRSGDEDEANRIRAKKRQVPYVIDRDKESDGPMAWPAAWTTNRDINAICINKRTQEVIYLDDPEEGYDLSFECVKKGEYSELVGMQVDRRPSPLSDDSKQMRRWLKFIQETPIPDTLILYDYGHIAKVLEGGAPKDDDKPRTRSERRGKDDRRSGKRRGKDDSADDSVDDSADDSVDDSADDSVDDSVDATVDKPKRSGKKTRKPGDSLDSADASNDDSVDDSADDSVDDSVDDPPPRKRSREKEKPDRSHRAKLKR